MRASFREVAPVFFQRLILFFRVLVGDALAAAHVPERLQDFLLRHALRFEQARARPLLVGHDAKQQVFRADVLVFHALGFVNATLMAARRRGVRLLPTSAMPPDFREVWRFPPATAAAKARH